MMNTLTTDALVNRLVDSGLVPHSLIRYGIRAQLTDRLRSISSTTREAHVARKMAYVASLRQRPVAIETAKANEQHYEVGTDVLAACLGPRMKYSACLFSESGTEGKEGELGEAEERMLEVYAERAGLADGQRVLDLGCGWGSAAVWIAERFPASRVTAFSNSRTQRTHIEAVARGKGLANLAVETGDVAEHEFAAASFDRIVSIELFEHMKNYEVLLSRLARALDEGGRLFVHMFTHRDTPYDFETGWMTEHFFRGGTMPSADLLLYFQRDLVLSKQWWVGGTHYARTCEAWLANMTKNKKAIMPALAATYGEEAVGMWFARWEVFYMACAELFAYGGGEVWGVSHYLFEKRE
jgi:cyclopropane fatty-acyl-phospholipid synthase-like methyltransferase